MSPTCIISITVSLADVRSYVLLNQRHWDFSVINDPANNNNNNNNNNNDNIKRYVVVFLKGGKNSFCYALLNNMSSGHTYFCLSNQQLGINEDANTFCQYR